MLLSLFAVRVKHLSLAERKEIMEWSLWNDG